VIEKIERTVIENGEVKKVVEIKEKELPKELQWILFCKKLEEMGYVVRYVYRDNGVLQEFITPKWVLDTEQGAPVPQTPEQIKIYEYKNGRGYVLKTIVENARNSIDPTAEESVALFDMLI